MASSSSALKYQSEEDRTKLELQYDEYVHFSYKIGLYTKEKAARDQKVTAKELVSWYCREYMKYTCKKSNTDYRRKIYRAAIDNMIEDNMLKKVATLEDTHDIQVKFDERFLTWSWRELSDNFEARQDAEQAAAASPVRPPSTSSLLGQSQSSRSLSYSRRQLINSNISNCNDNRFDDVEMPPGSRTGFLGSTANNLRAHNQKPAVK